MDSRDPTDGTVEFPAVRIFFEDNHDHTVRIGVFPGVEFIGFFGVGTENLGSLGCSDFDKGVVSVFCGVIHCHGQRGENTTAIWFSRTYSNDVLTHDFLVSHPGRRSLGCVILGGVFYQVLVDPNVRL